MPPGKGPKKPRRGGKQKSATGKGAAKTKARRKREREARAKKAPVLAAMSDKNIKRNIEFCGRAIAVLGSPGARKDLLKGELPPGLKRMSFQLATMEVMADAVPDESWLRAGIWLPSKEFLNARNKATRMLKLALFYGYWKHGPYFTPVHAAAHMLVNYVPELVKPGIGVRVGRLMRKRFTEHGKLRVTQGDLKLLLEELNRELARNRELLGEK